MGDSQNLANCAFVKQNENIEDKKKFALRGFPRNSCKGEKQSESTRKKISKALGRPHRIPLNRMPNGFPLSGNTKDEWPEEIEALLLGTNEYMNNRNYDMIYQSLCILLTKHK